MSFSATVLQVLIASPSDTSEHRDAIESLLNRWNNSRAVDSQVILLPRRYETSAVPQMGDDGQAVINSQLVSASDVVIAIFANTLGSSTPRAISGTVEEIKEAQKAGTPVHVYFSDAPVPRSHLEDVAALNEYKAKFDGLYGTFSDVGDLIEKVRNAIDMDVSRAAPATPLVMQARANPIASTRRETYTKFVRGVPTSATRRAIAIENKGDGEATEFLVQFSSLDGSDLNTSGVWMTKEPYRDTLYARQELEFPYERTMGSTSKVSITMTWTENGEQMRRTSTITL